jgi:exopolyphosphatase/pppGpp-phosphohydrolase
VKKNLQVHDASREDDRATLAGRCRAHLTGIGLELVDGEEEARAEAVGYRRPEKPVGRGPPLSPSGGGSSEIVLGMLSPKSTGNLNFCCRVMVTRIVSFIFL